FVLFPVSLLSRLFILFLASGPPSALHSFPTRRSSDLNHLAPATLPRRFCPVLPGHICSLPVEHPVRHDSRDRTVLFGPSSSTLRSEEHTSELQSRFDLVCRLLLEKKNNSTYITYATLS